MCSVLAKFWTSFNTQVLILFGRYLSYVWYWLLFLFMLLQVRMWSTNPDQFVEDEDDETYSYSVRISAQDLLLVCSISYCCSMEFCNL